MSTSLREEMLRYVPRTDDPEIRARQKHVARVLLDMDPELREEVGSKAHEDGLKQGLEKGVDQGRLLEARAVLRRVLARRELSVSTEDETRIEACAGPGARKVMVSMVMSVSPGTRSGRCLLQAETERRRSRATRAANEQIVGRWSLRAGAGLLTSTRRYSACRVCARTAADPPPALAGRRALSSRRS